MVLGGVQGRNLRAGVGRDSPSEYGSSTTHWLSAGGTTQEAREQRRKVPCLQEANQERLSDTKYPQGTY
jgi:hypothetical protein